MILMRMRFPVEKHFVKKNGRDVHVTRPSWGKKARMFPGKSPQLRRAENHLLANFLEYRNQSFIGDAIWNFQVDPNPWTCRIWAKFTFEFPESVYRVSHRSVNHHRRGEISDNLPDLSNLYEIVQDQLQAAGLIEDDVRIDSHDGSRRQASPDGKYWLTVELYEIPFPPAQENP